MNFERQAHSKQSFLVAFTCGTLLLAPHCGAAVIVSFEQVGSDVVATWRGDITLGLYNASDSNAWILAYSSFNSLGSSRSLMRVGHPNNPGDFFVGGAATVTTLVSQPTAGTDLSMIGPGVPFPSGFGFTGDTFQLPNFPGSPSSYFDFGSGSTYFMTWQNSTLSAIGAATFSNTLAWTSSAGGANTVSYTTVPEPGAALLGMVGGVCLLRRRRS
jgi:MYXO-CTERM domain-containing protein